MRQPLHQAAVTDEGPGKMIDYRRAATVEACSENLFGQRHADRIRQALRERAGGCLHAWRDADLGVTGRPGVKLAKIAQLFKRQVVAGQMQQRIQQHRAVPVREHEAVTIRPGRIRRVVLQVARPQCHGDLRHAHRHAGMTRVRLLHRVHRERTDRVGHLRGRYALPGLLKSRLGADAFEDLHT